MKPQQKAADQSPGTRKVGPLVKSPPKSPGRVGSPKDERQNKTAQETRPKPTNTSNTSDAMSVASSKRPMGIQQDTRSGVSGKSPSQGEALSNNGSVYSHVRNSPKGNRSAVEPTVLKGGANISPRRTALPVKSTVPVRPRPVAQSPTNSKAPVPAQPPPPPKPQKTHARCTDPSQIAQASMQSTAEHDFQNITLELLKQRHLHYHKNEPMTPPSPAGFRKRPNEIEQLEPVPQTRRLRNHQQQQHQFIPSRNQLPVAQQYREFVKNSPVGKYIDLRQSCLTKTNRLSMQQNVKEKGMQEFELDRRKPPQQTHTRRQPIKLSDFSFGKCLGSGKFGQVYLAKHKLTGMLVAIKKVGKFNIRQYKMEKQLIDEIRLQSFCNNPNIINLYGFFHDELHIYLVLEYATDDTLFTYLHRSGSRLQEKEAANLLKEVVYAVEFLHQHDIAHRDIKPQNILLVWGVAKLCDFGWSARMLEPRKSYCGTFEYTPPEMLERKEYDESVDLWCLGVLTFQLLTGEVPFGSKDRAKAKNKILNVDRQPLQYPCELSKQATSLIEGLIRKQPKERLRAQQLLQHPFFKQLPQQPHLPQRK